MSETSILLVVVLPFLALLVWSVAEIATRRDLNVPRRIGWLLLVVILPVIGVAAYIVLRPPRRAVATTTRADTARAEAIVVLAERRQRGEISDDEHRVEVRRVVETVRAAGDESPTS